MTKKFKALLLDERDVLRAVVELANEAELTERHVDLRPHGGDCDRKPGEYRWDRELKQLRPLPQPQRAREGRPTMEHAFAFLLLKQVMLPQPALDLPSNQSAELLWLDDVVRSVDFSAFLSLALVKSYIAARGLKINKGDR